MQLFSVATAGYTAFALAISCALACGNSTSSNTSIQNQTPPIENLTATVDFSYSEAFQNHQNQLEKIIPPKVQHFTVPKGKNQKVTGAAGISLWVDPAALETEKGNPVTGPIEVAMVEVVSPLDFMKNQASTLSNGKLLETGGSINLSLSSQGEPLRIKKGKSLKLSFPKAAQQKGMELFYGIPDSSVGMNWQAAGQKLRPSTNKKTVVPKESTNKTKNLDSIPAKALGKQKRMPMLPDLPAVPVGQLLCKPCIEAPKGYQEVFFPRGVDTTEWAIVANKGKYIVASNLREGTEYIFELEKALPPVQKTQTPPDFNVAKDKDQKESQIFLEAKIQKLGWINCDRFSGKESIPMVLASRDSLNATGFFQLMAFFPNLPAGYSLFFQTDLEKKLRFSYPFPKLEALDLLVFRFEKEKVWLAQPPVNVLPKETDTLWLDFEAVDSKQFKEILRQRFSDQAIASAAP